ncbi:hypothetical protein [Variovorax sp. EBFNA2]|uniref:hypothetical protein n=1 Tax=Variovorax sp. EBFNA2 TaxID=3342097 RepID=UPI0029C0582C|nr:hypothetical protein [Variovorax boronicumulans]WPG36731.1 hypothetical protein RZE79_25090 [Variovorax boronicumulans]
MTIDSEKKPHTVFVLGAGASFEAGLPVGAELKNRIAKLIDIRFSGGHHDHTGDYAVMEAFRSYGRENRIDVNNLLRAAWGIRDAMPQAISIDNFLDAHRGNILIEIAGKIAITRAILAAESKSKLYVNRVNSQLNFGNLDGTWYNKFFQVLTENCRLDDMPERISAVSIISFNYDRCLRHFLLHSMQNYYQASRQKIEPIINKLEILYPYGSVGVLPEIEKNHENETPFGEELHGSNLLAIASKIKTFTEGTDEAASEIIRIRQVMQQSSRIFFLGFAFHPLNMELLAPKGTASEDQMQRVVGTAFGLSNSDIEVISDDLNDRLGSPLQITLPSITCSDLFSQYSRTLSMT